MVVVLGTTYVLHQNVRQADVMMLTGGEWVEDEKVII